MSVFLFVMFLRVLAPRDYPDYNNYHEGIARSEYQYFVKGNATAAFAAYDSLLLKFDFVFVCDFFIAAQAACRQHDQRRTRTYLDACFRNGLPLQALSLAPVLTAAGIGPDNREIQSAYQKLRPQYLRHIDYDYRASVYRMYCEDQVNKSLPRIRYNALLRAQLEKLLSDIRLKGFPSDKVLGIDDAALQIKGRNLQEWYAGYCLENGVQPEQSVGRGVDNTLSSCTIMPLLVHYPCAYEVIRSVAADEIAKGNLHPRDLALLYDNMLQMQGLITAGDRCGGRPDSFFKLNMFCVYPQDWRLQTSRINALRAAWGICSLEQDSIRREKMKEYGFYYKYGFWSCR